MSNDQQQVKAAQSVSIERCLQKQTNRATVLNPPPTVEQPGQTIMT